MPFRPQQPIEQPDVGEHRREKLAVILGLLRAQRLAVQQNLARLRLIESGQQHRQRRFTAAVAADEEQQFTAAERQVDRPHGEGAVLIAKRDVTQLQRLPVREGLRAREFGFKRREIEFFELIKGHLRTQQGGQRTDR